MRHSYSSLIFVLIVFLGSQILRAAEVAHGDFDEGLLITTLGGGGVVTENSTAGTWFTQSNQFGWYNSRTDSAGTAELMDGNAARGLVQIIDAASAHTGMHRLRFDWQAVTDDPNATFRVQVYGLPEGQTFTLDLGDSGVLPGGDDGGLANVLLSETVLSGPKEQPGFTTEQYLFDIGATGYPRLAVRFTAYDMPSTPGGADAEPTGQFLRIDNVSLLAGAQNDAPIAQPDDFAQPILVGESVLLDVLANDSDPNLTDPLSLAAITAQPAVGVASIDEGKITYTSPADAVEQAVSFQYTITDGLLESDPATVSLQLVTPGGSLDSDNDGLPDGWEIATYGNLDADGTGDFDGDGVSDGAEFRLSRDPARIDRANLSWQEGFEDWPVSPLEDSPGMLSLPGAADSGITNGVGAGDPPSRALVLRRGTGATKAAVAQYLDTGYHRVLWTQLTAKLPAAAPGDAPPSPSLKTAVLFYLLDDGAVAVLNGDTWQMLELGLDTSVAHTYTIRQDFPNHQWKLWVNGNLVTPQTLDFAYPVNSLDALRLENETADDAVFDELSISPAAPGGLSSVNGYWNWAGSIAWNGADDSPEADPNHNGLTNIEEYILGMATPHIQGENLPRITLLFDNGILTLVHPINPDAEDAHAWIETSTDLKTWRRQAFSRDQIRLAYDDGILESHYTLPEQDVAAFFCRLSLEWRGEPAS